MPSPRKAGLLITLVSFLLLYLSPSQAAMVTTESAIGDIDRAQLVTMLERDDVQQQLIDMGVDPADALERVAKMTDEEVAELNGKIAQLPAGAGLNAVELLLIIIIIILLV
jgi:hypothetical protein